MRKQSEIRHATSISSGYSLKHNINGQIMCVTASVYVQYNTTHSTNKKTYTIITTDLCQTTRLTIPPALSVGSNLVVYEEHDKKHAKRTEHEQHNDITHTLIIILSTRMVLIKQSLIYSILECLQMFMFIH